MNENGTPETKGPKWIRLTARIWSAPIILYGLLLAAGYTWSWLTTGVADPFAVQGTTFFESLPPILLFISILGLALGWHWEQSGGIFSLIFAAGTLLVLILQGYGPGDLSRSLIPYLLTIIVAVPGILFLIYGFRYKDRG